MRAVVDANVWISALLNAAGPPARVLQAFRAGRFALVMSEAGLEEIRAVLCRPRFQRYGLTPAIARDFTDLLRAGAELVTLAGTLTRCRDPKDNHLIELALAGAADVLVSRDEDLTRDPELMRFLAARQVRPLTVQHFLTELGDH